ncbi:MAG: M12 family metallopeptidase [Acidobacteriota bacterium]|nr:M12 family metallopeptidase [Acidobacteriota bacterium]MDH3528163.1 M12 family metallopeptidase [Acidobacteriota bacterium]
MNAKHFSRLFDVIKSLVLISVCLVAPAAMGQDKIDIPLNSGGVFEFPRSDLPVLDQKTRQSLKSQAATRGGQFSELMARPTDKLPSQKKVFFCSSANRMSQKPGDIRAVGGLDCGPNRDASCFWKKPFITVGFMNGTPEIKQIVYEVIAEWTTWANVAFVVADIGEFPNRSPDIKVRFEEGGGHYSYLGIDSWLPVIRAEPNKPTLQLGFLDPPLRYPTGEVIDNVRGTILHEFGHSLGLHHEHQSPKVGIRWNREAVIKDLSGPPNYWSVPEIESNIFRALAEDRTKSTEYDPSSIMHYSYPAAWTLNNVSMPENETLSETDKRFISEIYPRRKVVVEADRYFRLMPLYHGRKACMSVASSERGLVPFLAPCDETLQAQLWKFTHVGNGDYRITNYLTGSEVSLVDFGVEYYAGLQKSGDYDGQKWTITELGGLKRMSSKSSGILNSLTADTKTGTELTLDRTAHWANQLWEFDPVELTR